MRGMIGTNWPLLETFKDRTEDDMKEVRGFIEPIVLEAIRKKAKGLDSKESESLLDHLVTVTQGECLRISFYTWLQWFLDMKLIVDETIK